MEMIWNFINIGTALVAIASAVAALTNTKKDDDLVGKAQKLLDLVALNIGKAKN